MGRRVCKQTPSANDPASRHTAAITSRHLSSPHATSRGTPIRAGETRRPQDRRLNYPARPKGGAGPSSTRGRAKVRLLPFSANSALLVPEVPRSSPAAASTTLSRGRTCGTCSACSRAGLGGRVLALAPAYWPRTFADADTQRTLADNPFRSAVQRSTAAIPMTRSASPLACQRRGSSKFIEAHRTDTVRLPPRLADPHPRAVRNEGHVHLDSPDRGNEHDVVGGADGRAVRDDAPPLWAVRAI
jgi:hypothetical protein